jgi:hypothetical protein
MHDARKETAMIELTDEQMRAIEGCTDTPVEVLNPRTKDVFVLVRQDIYQRVQRLIDGPNRRGWDDPELDVYEQYRKKT